MIDDNIGFSMGKISVETTNNKGHDVEFWAEDAASMVPCEENAVVWEADAERSEDESKNTLLEE